MCVVIPAVLRSRKVGWTRETLALSLSVIRSEPGRGKRPDTLGSRDGSRRGLALLERVERVVEVVETSRHGDAEDLGLLVPSADRSASVRRSSSASPCPCSPG
jgi:hypothetical protein